MSSDSIDFLSGSMWPMPTSTSAPDFYRLNTSLSMITSLIQQSTISVSNMTTTTTTEAPSTISANLSLSVLSNSTSNTTVVPSQSFSAVLLWYEIYNFFNQTMNPRLLLDRGQTLSEKMSLLYALERGTSPVDWCELNYAHSPMIAETINTISNILFLVYPPILCQLFKQYANNIDRGIYIIWTLFAVVGICSAYFHATLSLLGQLLDELAILWLLAFSFGMWLPKKYFPSWIKEDRRKFKNLLMFGALVASAMACIYPWINAFALMSLSIPTCILMINEVQKCQIPRIKRLGRRCIFFSLAAIGSWILDRAFCDTWSAYNLPYLHGVWHILIAIASYILCILFAYFDAIREHHHLCPVIKYWPRDDFEHGIPYIELKNAY